MRKPLYLGAIRRLLHFLVLLFFYSCPLLGQEEIKSFGDRPWALTAQLSYLGDIGSVGSIAVEQRRKSSTSKFRQSGIRIGAQQVSLYFYDEVKGFGLCCGAYFLAGQTHCLDLHAGGSMIYDTSPRRTTFSSFSGTNGRSPNSGRVGLTLWPLLSAGYRYVSPDPAGMIFKVGIGTLGLYAGLGFKL